MRDLDIAAAEEDTDEARILCARCYSLSHYGWAPLHMNPWWAGAQGMYLGCP